MQKFKILGLYYQITLRICTSLIYILKYLCGNSEVVRSWKNVFHFSF